MSSAAEDATTAVPPRSPGSPAPARRPYRGGRREAGPAPRCAWVVLLMIGKAYAPGALVVAHSLRAVRTRHPLVCMVTHDVPEETRAQLRGTPERPIYDRVVEVPYIQHPTRRFASQRQEEMYGGWIDRSFTKWNCLAFTEYDRVLFVDADMVALANCDDLFELAPPAASYSHPWARPWQAKGGIRSPYVAEGEADLPHGARIPAALVLDTLAGEPFGGASYVGGGSLVLLEPCAERHAEYLALVREREVYGDRFAVTSGGDESSIAYLYARAGADWTNIHQRYLAIPWKTEWVSRDIRVYHYLGRKPWLSHVGEWPDLADWWSLADRLIALHPDLRKTFYPDVTEVSPLDAELAQIQLSNDIRARILSAAKRDCAPRERTRLQREVNNVLERWLLSMAHPCGCPGSGQEETGRTWAGVYRVTTLENDFNNKLAGELIDAGFPGTSSAAGWLVADILDLVRKRLEHLPRPSGYEVAVTDTHLSYGSGCRGALTPRIKQLVAIGGKEAAARVVMRYLAVISAGQQWGLPAAHVSWLCDHFGVRNEAFASPLNARLLGKPGARYCSLYPDTDAPFGSIGDFFAQDLAILDGNWVVNPPFIETVLVAAARRFTGALEDGLVRTVFFVTPAWADCEACAVLDRSPHLVAKITLEPGQYYFENAAGDRVHTRSPSYYYALSGEASTVRAGLKSALQQVTRC